MNRLARTACATLLSAPALCVLGAVGSASAQAPAVTQNTDRVAETAPSTDTQNWTASLGGVLNTGNTQSYSLSGGTAFSIIRGTEGFSLESTGNYGRAVPATGGGFETNARNVSTKIRYDHFFAERHAGFVSLVHRWDTFSGLDLRFQAQVGYQYNFIREEKHRLWTEIGYDFTFDNLVQTGVPAMPADDTVAYHSARLYVGWENSLNEHVSYKTGLEALMTLDNANDWRLNWTNTLNVAVASKLQIELKFNVLYDHEPVPNRQTTDTRTMLNLVLDMW